MADLPLVQGKQPDSKEEVFFAYALMKYDVPFYYQWVIGRNRGLRGAIVVDFVIIRPFYQPVEVFGRYWHAGKLGSDDRLKLAIEQHYFRREPIVIWSDEIDDQEKADQYVRSKIA